MYIYIPVGLEPVLQEAVFLHAVVEEGEQLPVVTLSRILRKRERESKCVSPPLPHTEKERKREQVCKSRSAAY